MSEDSGVKYGYFIWSESQAYRTEDDGFIWLFVWHHEATCPKPNLGMPCTCKTQLFADYRIPMSQENPWNVHREQRGSEVLSGK